MHSLDNRKADYTYPQTGRIGRFIKILSASADTKAIEAVLENADQYCAYNAEKKAAWWNAAMEKLQTQLGKEQAISVMCQCGAKCCGKGQRSTAKRLFCESKSMPEFLDTISRHDVRDGELAYTQESDNTIIAEYHRCFCRQVADAVKPFESMIYCHCSEEFNRQFFSAVFGKPVQVELLQSIICGADTCRFRITY